MSATLPPLKIHHRCPLAHSPRLLLWQTFFQGADDITQIRERTIKAINPWWYLLLDKKTRLEPWIFMFSSPSLLLEHCPPHDPVLLLFDCCSAWRMSTWSWNTNWDSKGLVPFTQLVKVRRGKLVLALPSIRFSWNFYKTSFIAQSRAIWRLMTECCEINLCPWENVAYSMHGWCFCIFFQWNQKVALFPHF